MRYLRRLGSALCAVSIAGCVMPGGGSSSLQSDVSSSPKPAMPSAQERRDSAYAQFVADREGPGVSLDMQFINVSGARRASASFHVDDDAYVLVGHIDSDGVLRVIFPTNPGDDGFVKGQHTYRTPEFLAGFLPQYRQSGYSSLYHTAAASDDAYNGGGVAFTFVIASWRPMHFDRFATVGDWDTFELSDQNYMNDPRPAIYEFASLLAGDNHEAYTVKFARSSTSDGSFGYQTFNAYESQYGSEDYCTGAQPFGFVSNPFDAYGPREPGAYWGDNFSYRGANYYYDSRENCYRQGYGLGSYQYPISTLGFGSLPPAGQGQTPRVFNLDAHRSPPTPFTPLPGYLLPISAVGQGTTPSGATTVPTAVHVSPQYRDRGLITNDDPSTGSPARRDPRVNARTPGDDHTRPSIQQMVNRRDGTHEAATQAADAQFRGRQSGNQTGDQGSSRYTPRNNGGDDQSHQRQTSPSGGRAPEEHSAPSYSAPRSAPPAPAPAPARASSPPPAPAPTPASSSTGSGAPIKP